jgi:hypothetical protein
MVTVGVEAQDHAVRMVGLELLFLTCDLLVAAGADDIVPSPA